MSNLEALEAYIEALEETINSAKIQIEKLEEKHREALELWMAVKFCEG